MCSPNMALKTSLLALAVLSRLASASPASSSSTEAEVGLRLVKTSEDDPGQWVSEEAKFELFTSKGLGFIDITDIKDAEVLAALSTKPANSAGIQAVGYPSALAHIEEANALIDSSSTDGPKEWLEHLASCVPPNEQGRYVPRLNSPDTEPDITSLRPGRKLLTGCLRRFLRSPLPTRPSSWRSLSTRSTNRLSLPAFQEKAMSLVGISRP